MGPSIWQLLIILVIALLLFGTKRIGNLGSDLGTAIKGFRNAMNEGEKEPPDAVAKLETASGSTLDGAVRFDEKERV
jgi:sec-independent protein translocase protein TatA